MPSRIFDFLLSSFAFDIESNFNEVLFGISSAIDNVLILDISKRSQMLYHHC